jgi:hypothetical protein
MPHMCPVGPAKFGTEGIIALSVFSLPFFEAMEGDMLTP